MKDKYLDAIVNIDDLNQKTKFKRYPPCEQLRDIVDLFWSIEWSLGDQVLEQEILPNPHVNMVFDDNGQYVEGVVKSYFSYTLRGAGSILGVKFKVGGFNTIFPMDVGELTNKKIALNNFTSENWDLYGMTTSDKISFIESKLIKMRQGTFDPLASNMVAYIRSQQIYKVEDLCSRFNLSLRQVQRIFKSQVGVNAKWVIRIFRLQELKVLLENQLTVDWPGLAYQLGYSDQAHMINDFKRVVGKTPKDFKENRI